MKTTEIPFSFKTFHESLVNLTKEKSLSGLIILTVSI